MFVRRTLGRLILTSSLLVPLALTTASCSNAPPAKTATVKAGEMPEGGDWSGVYFDPVYGYLHLVKEGDTVSGKWRNTEGNAWGEMSGTANGDLYKYEWKEHKIGMVGKSATSEGRGYFKYAIPKAGEAHEIRGEWGLGQDEAGRKWVAVKQFNRRPDPNSVMPDEVERRGQGGGWDESEGAKPPSGGGSNKGGDKDKDKDKDKGGDMPAPVE
jgi:hypothetical protein